jgi:2-polyprenyl-6-methoxyphenol hydroxylase-like FAD-dependent oxidoreductase
MSSSSVQTTQVLILGAGPTGLSLAAQLIRHGVDFILLEKKDTTTKLSKALVVQARTMEIFQELGIADEAIRRGLPTTGLRLFFHSKLRVAVDLNGLGRGLSEFTFALSLEQSKTEKLLLEYIERHGKSVEWNSEISGFEQDENGVTIHYKSENGEKRKANAKYLVGCDGADSLVRHKLGLTFEGDTAPRLFYVADVVLESSVIKGGFLYMFPIHKGFVLFFPMEGENHYRIIGVLPPDADMNKEHQFSEIDVPAQIKVDLTIKELRWFSTYKVHSRKANAFMKSRCFIAGDAGHIHTPAGGQGMNTGIQDAYNLAWKLAYTLRGETNPNILKSYDSERGGNAKQLLRTTDQLFDLMSGVNPFWSAFRLWLFPPIIRLVANNRFTQKLIFPRLGQIGIAYPDSNLTRKSRVGKVKAGDRMHYFVFANGRSIFSFLKEPVFKLIYFGDRKMENPLGETGIKLSFMSFAEIPESIFGKAMDFFILLRPDNHVSYIGKDLEKCKKSLAQLKS